jgi:hypothetical protein
MVLVPGSPEAIALYREGKLNKVKNREVCVCGHSMAYHTEVGDRVVCSPAKIRSCRCSVGRPVLEADNLRMFMSVTSGVGTEHALGKGLTASAANEHGVHWLGGHGTKCDLCLGELGNTNRIPLALDPYTGMPAERSTGVDKILCMSCYLEVQGAGISVGSDSGDSA